MKFITSTDLKLWASTKDCQEYLPELIRRLILCSVNGAEKLTIPSGDSVFIPGWDGILSSFQNCDQVPAGISLWEFGASDQIKAKIDSDFTKRLENPLGYDSQNSTFVFVTPRIWEGAENWIHEHKHQWKHIVIYTAIELESWIEQCPSVGMWLAERRNILPAGGYMLPQTYWNNWATGEEITLPYTILLAGREHISKELVDNCQSPKVSFINALTESEGIAFAVASLLHNEKSSTLEPRVIIADKLETYEDLVNHYKNLIIITCLGINPHVAVSKGHNIIRITTPANPIKDAVDLPIIEHDGFINALERDCHLEHNHARRLTLSCTRDINILRRSLKIDLGRPVWAETQTLKALLPAILVGKWNAQVKGDCEIMTELSGRDYEDYQSFLTTCQIEFEFPILDIDNQWRLKAPYEMMERVLHLLTPSILQKIQEICLRLVADDDSDTLTEFKEDTYCLSKFNQHYSDDIKNGVYQNLVLLSIIGKEQSDLNRWVKVTISKMLQNWDLKRWLSNLDYLNWLAEAAPDTFITFMEQQPDALLRELFTPQPKLYSLNGYEIYYSSILFALETLAWDTGNLYRITNLLIKYLTFKNDSNYANRPINSLKNIYRPYLPQTNADFHQQYNILRNIAQKEPHIIFELGLHFLNSLKGGFIEYNQRYRWRQFSHLSSQNKTRPNLNELKKALALTLQCCPDDTESICQLLELSSHKSMSWGRGDILKYINSHQQEIKGNETVTKTLRTIINHHMSSTDTDWALPEKDLECYQTLLADLQPSELLEANRWKFEKFYIDIPYQKDKNWEEELHEILQIRNKTIQQILDEKGNEGLWTFIQMVKFPNAIAESLVDLFTDSYIHVICDKYLEGIVDLDFCKQFLWCLYRKDAQSYLQNLDTILHKDRRLAFILYAPYYVRELAEKAEKEPADIYAEYWENVYVGRMVPDEETEWIINRLLKANRYMDTIKCLYDHLENKPISDIRTVQILHSALVKGKLTLNGNNSMFIKRLIESLDQSEDTEVIKPLLWIEFVLFEHLRHHMDIPKLRLIKEMKSNPELFMELIEMSYLSDDEISNKDKIDSTDQQRLFNAKCASKIIHETDIPVPGVDEKGNLDIQILKNYINRLYALAAKKKRTKVIDYFIGDIIGRIPRTDEYPQSELSQLVEELNNDTIDRHIKMTIFNSKGITGRAWNEGGTVERSDIEKFKKYKESCFTSPRMTRIFENLIEQNEYMAQQQDHSARINDIEYY